MTPRDEQFPRTNKVLNDLMREEIEARDAEIIRLREELAACETPDEYTKRTGRTWPGTEKRHRVERDVERRVEKLEELLNDVIEANSLWTGR